MFFELEKPFNKFAEKYVGQKCEQRPSKCAPDKVELWFKCLPEHIQNYPDGYYKVTIKQELIPKFCCAPGMGTESKAKKVELDEK